MTRSSTWRQIARIHERYGKLKSFSPAGRHMAIRAEMVRLGLAILPIDGPAYRAPVAPVMIATIRNRRDIDFLVDHSVTSAGHHPDPAQPATEVGPVRKGLAGMPALLRVALGRLTGKQGLGPVEDQAKLGVAIRTVAQQRRQRKVQGVLDHEHTGVQGVRHRFHSGIEAAIKAVFGGRVE